MNILEDLVFYYAAGKFQINPSRLQLCVALPSIGVGDGVGAGDGDSASWSSVPRFFPSRDLAMTIWAFSASCSRDFILHRKQAGWRKSSDIMLEVWNNGRGSGRPFTTDMGAPCPGLLRLSYFMIQQIEKEGTPGKGQPTASRFTLNAHQLANLLWAMC